MHTNQQMVIYTKMEFEQFCREKATESDIDYSEPSVLLTSTVDSAVATAILPYAQICRCAPAQHDLTRFDAT